MDDELSAVTDIPPSLDDRLRKITEKIDLLSDAATVSQAEADRQLGQLSKQLDHLDQMLHETQQHSAEVREFVEANRGHLEQAIEILHNPVKSWLDKNRNRKAGKDAGRIERA